MKLSPWSRPPPPVVVVARQLHRPQLPGVANKQRSAHGEHNRAKSAQKSRDFQDWKPAFCLHTSHSHGHRIVHPPFFACLAFMNGGTSLMSCQTLEGCSRGRVPPIAQCTKASPSVRAGFASSSWHGPRQRTTSPPQTGTACSPAVVQVTKVGWKPWNFIPLPPAPNYLHPFPSQRAVSGTHGVSVHRIPKPINKVDGHERCTTIRVEGGVRGRRGGGGVRQGGSSQRGFRGNKMGGGGQPIPDTNSTHTSDEAWEE